MPLPYDLATPRLALALPGRFREISGLCALPCGGRVAFVQDEAVRVFHLELSTGEIVRYPKIGKGDAEDLAIVDGTAYILKAGKKPAIHRIVNYQSSDPDVTRFDLDLDRAHDPEGLCYDPAEHRLLIACKGSPRRGSPERAIFSFSLETGRRSGSPLFCVDASLFLAEGKQFNPSGIAVHPVCHDLFLVGTKGAKRIVRYGVDGSFKGAWRLDAGLFPQPEGITFLGSGDLVIASEGKKSRRPGRGGRGSVMLFPMLGSPGSPTAPPGGQGCDRAQPH